MRSLSSLVLTRQLHLARDNQREALWRGMISDRALREQNLGGKTLVVIGLGRIGTPVARLARAFEMRVIGVRRTARPAPDASPMRSSQSRPRPCARRGRPSWR